MKGRFETQTLKKSGIVKIQISLLPSEIGEGIRLVPFQSKFIEINYNGILIGISQLIEIKFKEGTTTLIFEGLPHQLNPNSNILLQSEKDLDFEFVVASQS